MLSHLWGSITEEFLYANYLAVMIWLFEKNLDSDRVSSGSLQVGDRRRGRQFPIVCSLPHASVVGLATGVKGLGGKVPKESLEIERERAGKPAEMSIPLSRGERLRYALTGIVVVLSILTAFWGLPDRSLDSHECYVSVTAREMVTSGDYVFPTMNGAPRLKKPPLSYWLVAGISQITGQCDEWAARLPSAIAGVLSAVSILYFVSRWTSWRTGLLSVGVWVTSEAYLEWSHSARAEMLMTFFCTFCLLAFFDIQRYQSPKRRWVLVGLFWLSFALANLAKGPIPFPVVFLPILAYILLRKKGSMLTRLHPILGLLFMLAIALPWPLAIAAQLNWDLTLWKNEVFSRMAGEYASRGRPFYYYLPIMFKYAAPWVVILPMGLLSPFYRIWGRRRPLMAYLWLWFIAGVLFFTISQGKRPHYILPQMPAAAILMGIVLDDLVFARKAFSALFARRVLAIHAIALAAAALVCVGYAIVYRSHLPNSMLVAGFGIVFFVGWAACFLRSESRRRRLAVPLFFLSLGLVELFGISIYDRLFDSYKDMRDFALKVRAQVPQNDKLWVYGDLSNVFLHYFGRPIPLIEEPEAIKSHCSQGHWVVVLRADLSEECMRQGCRIVLAQEDRPRQRHSVEGFLLHAPTTERLF